MCCTRKSKHFRRMKYLYSSYWSKILRLCQNCIAVLITLVHHCTWSYLSLLCQSFRQLTEKCTKLFCQKMPRYLVCVLLYHTCWIPLLKTNDDSMKNLWLLFKVTTQQQMGRKKHFKNCSNYYLMLYFGGMSWGFFKVRCFLICDCL